MVSKLYTPKQFYELQEEGKIGKNFGKYGKLYKRTDGYYVYRKREGEYVLYRISPSSRVYSRGDHVSVYNSKLDKLRQAKIIKMDKKKFERYKHIYDNKKISKKVRKSKFPKEFSRKFMKAFNLKEHEKKGYGALDYLYYFNSDENYEINVNKKFTKLSKKVLDKVKKKEKEIVKKIRKIDPKLQVYTYMNKRGIAVVVKTDSNKNMYKWKEMKRIN